jgi:hypothetical protein
MRWFSTAKTRSHQAGEIPVRIMTAALAAIALFGCSGDRDKPAARVQAALQLIEKEFGFQWPTNYTDIHFARLHMDGGKGRHWTNYETMIRFKVPAATFSTWRSEVTNSLKYTEGYYVRGQAYLTRRYSWWNPSAIPPPEVSYFFSVIGDPKSFTNVDIYAAPEGQHYRMYIHRFVMLR